MALLQYSHLPCLSFLLLFIILIASFPATFCNKNVALFQNCSSSFSCGDMFPNIRYPFWGGNRSSECGEDGFRLTCVKDDHVTIDISGYTYRVLPPISNTTYYLNLSASDDGCPQDYENRSIYGSPFRPTGPPHPVQALKLYSSCRDPERGRNQFSCTNPEGSNPARIDYFFNDSGGGCASSISVPALRDKVDEFNRTGSSMSLRDLVYTRFIVEYSFNLIVCSGCLASNGLCWHRTNSTEKPTCLCPDGSTDLSLCREEGRKQNVTSVKILIGIVASVFSALILCMACIFKHRQLLGLMLRRKTKEGRNLEEFIKQYRLITVERYSYSYIRKMTLSFKDRLGQGGYGTVYKGKLFDGRLVAVKLLNVSKGNGEEFINEVMSFSRTSHVNIVRLQGFCMEGKKRALVYEYMPNGSLEKYIHWKKSEFMNINQLGMDELYQISLGVARGLEYLHRGCNTRIMHFDIKPHNILLDENFRPKISDFGMAKQCKMNESLVSIMGARGTIGYIAPELESRAFGVVSYKSDVYSYGMMILEIVGRRKNVSLDTSHASEVYFPHWVYQHLVIDNDLRLKNVTQEEDEIARKIILVGLWCVQNDPSLRPTMSKAIEMLEGDLQTIMMPPKSFLGFLQHHWKHLSPIPLP